MRILVALLSTRSETRKHSGCDIQVKQGHHFVWTLWLPSVLVETLCFSLVVGKYFSARSMGAASDLLGRLAVDSFLYYVPIVILSIACVLPVAP